MILANKYFAVINNYFLLTKPRVQTLLVFSSLSGAFLAERGVPNMISLVGLLLGGYFAAGGSSALNMYFEKDIDKNMGRTKNRPIVEGKLKPKNALVFGIILIVSSFLILFTINNLLAALLALLGSLLYVGFYTLYIKQRTVQNIVVGGAAGAIPPLVGYASISNSITLEALYLFLIIFFWTPPHFWALAIMIKDDYEKAKIPMLPVVKGIKNTSLQIFLYSIILLFITVLTGVVANSLGWIFMISSILVGGIFIYKSFKLFKIANKKEAISTYIYSLLYLFVIMSLVIVDSSIKFMEF